MSTVESPACVTPREQRRRRVAHRVGLLVTVTAAVWVLGLDAAPSPMAPDALLESQWHLKDRAVEVGAANVRAAWPTTLGTGVVIGIVDDGLQYTHPDLSPNYLASASWDFNFNDGDPFPTAGHGTLVAGIAAARGDNTIGVSGVAPEASLAGLRLTALTATDSQEAAAFGYLPDVIDILNNAWSPSDNGFTLKGPGPLAVAARTSAATTGRSGKGRIFVWPAGDGRLNNDNCNFDGYANSRFAIAVGAMDDTGLVSPTTEMCSALAVLAPAGLGTRALISTDLLGTPGYNAGDYTGASGNTSSPGGNTATATVSGAVALMLARNPSLTWRDVQHILRRTSVRIEPTSGEWTTGAFPHSQRHGFGLLDAQAAVAMAGTWANVPAEEVLVVTSAPNASIPDSNMAGINDTITIPAIEANFVIEHVEVEFNSTHPRRGDLMVTLTSPAGVSSELATVRPNDLGANFTGWKFGSLHHWGEYAAGGWTLNVADRVFKNLGTWNNWTLRIYGYHGALPQPGAFSHASPANGATGQPTNPTLSWTASYAAASYEYCIDTSNNGACDAAWISTGTNTTAALSGLAAGTPYSWQVRAINASGTTYANGAATAFWGFTTQVPPPGGFSHQSPATGATGQSTSPSLSWGASSGAAGYEYCIDTTNDNACTGWLSVGAATSVGLSGLTSGTPYYWQVRASNVGGTTYAEGSATAYWNFTPLAVPGAFSHSSPANAATGQSLSPTLSWTASTGAASYEYCYDTINNGACDGSWVSAGSATSVGLTGLAAGTPYYWHVRAINLSGTKYAEASPTAFWSFTTQSPPGPFSHVSPANGATGQSLSPILTWGDSANAKNYEFCYDTTNDGACSVWSGAGLSTSVGLSGLAAGTTYYWQARATSAGVITYADGAASAFWSFTTAPASGPFSRTSPANGATGVSLSPTLSWGASAGASSYEYCIDMVNDAACGSSWTTTGSTTSVTLSGLTASTPYYWHVRAVGAGGVTYANGLAASFWSFTTLGPPGAFTHTSPANGATGQSLSPTLSWGASAGATSYEYCYDTTNDGACSVWTSTGTNTSVALGSLAPGTPYYWQVRATNTAGITYADGAAAAYWSFTTLPVPGAFTHSSPASGATNQPLSPTLSWTASTGAASYEYCYDTSNNGACDTSWVSVGTSTSVNLNGLASGTLFAWHVRATNASGTVYAEGSASTFWSFTTVSAPGAFNHTSPADAGTGISLSPTLSWGASAGAASYEYCIDTTNDSACSGWTSTGTTTSVALSGLPSNTAHYWQVRALNAGGTTYANASATAYWSFTTLVVAPGAFNRTSPANASTGQSASPTLSWGASAGATSYEYCIDTTNDSACSGWTGTGTTTSVALSNLIAGTSYYWHVRATNAGGTTFADGSATTFWKFSTAAAVPFGQVDSPAQNAGGLQGAVGVTGWALDDVGVTSIRIFRNCLAFEPGNCQSVLGNSVVYVGDAVFLEGARPDVAAAYSAYPQNTRAGWGYLMMTSLLPHVPNGQPFGGQGPLTLYVVATDVDGNQTLLGRSTDPASPGFAVPTAITMTNDTIARPFGSIDTPTQGETISGIFNNFGWALAPDANATSGDPDDILIPTNGSTMTVFIDGLPVSLVAYNQCRGTVGNPVPAGVYCNDDVASIFGNPSPQAPLTTRTSNPTKFRNLDAGRAAIGAFTIDTTTLSNGMHSIAWSVTDSAGRTEGIGSRFFNVLNGAASVEAGAARPMAPQLPLGPTLELVSATPVTEGVWGRTGYDLAEAWKPMHASDGANYTVRLAQLGRLELWLGEPVDAGYLVANDALQPLPVGATLTGSLFAWMPPAGYFGGYHLVFIRGGARIDVTVAIGETPRVVEGESQIKMHLDPVTQHAAVAMGARNERSVRVEGWAFDPNSAVGSGIGAVQVWATKAGSSSAVFLGSAVIDQARTDDVAGRPTHTGFVMTTSLDPGTYTLTAYVWNGRTERWEDSRSLQVIVR